MSGADGVAVISGVGQVSVLGIGGERFAAALDRQPASSESRLWEVEEFNLRDYVRIKTQCLDKASAMALVCSR